MFEVVFGENSDEAQKRRQLEVELLVAGKMKLTIPLNGGRETRRNTIEDYQELYGNVFGLTLQISSFQIIVRKAIEDDCPF